MENREIRHIVRRVAGDKLSGRLYKATCHQYNQFYTSAFTSIHHAKTFHATLLRHTERYYQKFGHEQAPSALAAYIDEQRDGDRWSFLDAFFEENPMDGHNVFVCPVCENVTETGYVSARCHNFECSRYDEELWTWAKFQEWLKSNTLEVDGLGLERYEYKLDHNWEAQEIERLEQKLDLETLVNLSDKMREIVQHGDKIASLLKRNLPGTQAGVVQYPTWQLVGPRLPKQGDAHETFVSIAQGLDGDHKSYLERKRTRRTRREYPKVDTRVARRQYLAKHPSIDATQRRWYPESPESWDYTANPHAVAAQGYGSLVVSR